MELLHEELRRARERAGLSQQALADKAGIPRNQVVRAERGENITIDTLRKIVAYLPVTDLPLLDTKGLRVDVLSNPDKMLFGALENVIRLSEAMAGAIVLAMDAVTAWEAARRSAPPEVQGVQTTPPDPRLLLVVLQRIAGEIQELGKVAKIA
jgi:transcriptional regulator with XRE-family HTH domain